MTSKERIETLLTALDEANSLAQELIGYLEAESIMRERANSELALLVGYAQSVRDELSKESEAGE